MKAFYVVGAALCMWARSSLPAQSQIGVAAYSPAAQSRAAALVQRMTLDEKLQLVHGTGRPLNTAGYAGLIRGIPRLGIPDLIIGDGPSGVGNGAHGVTAFPSPLTVASTWDTALALQYGTAVGNEHFLKGHGMA